MVKRSVVNRVLREHSQLLNKCKKLKSFLNSDSFDSVSDYQQSLLYAQFNVMRLYLRILSVRLDFFELEDIED